jgi:hypothetical protein
MIYESYYWKLELYKNYRYLLRFRTLKHVKAESFIKLEKTIMISAYIIRKLDDAEKIPPDFLEEKISVKKYMANDKIIDHLNWHHIEENYQLENELDDENNWKYFINQIIHSFTFMPVFNDSNNFDGIMLNSDKSKNKNLYYISLHEIIKLLLKISEGSIVESHKQREFKIHRDGSKIVKDMHQIFAKYEYPLGFKLDEIVNESLKGMLYIRDKMYYK